MAFRAEEPWVVVKKLAAARGITFMGSSKFAINFEAWLLSQKWKLEAALEDAKQG